MRIEHFLVYDPREHVWITDELGGLKRSFLPGDLEPLLRRAGFDGCIAVEARQLPHENEWLLELARTHASIRGIVPWVDLCAPDVTARLESLAGHPEIKGFRHVVIDEPDDRFLLRDDFQRGIAVLGPLGFTYDLLILFRHAAAAVQLARKFPEQRFVLDHLGLPDIRARELVAWTAGLKELAACPNVFCKLSGLVYRADWERWRPEDFAPYLDAALELFGPERLMIGRRLGRMTERADVTKPPPPQGVILEMWSGYVVSRALYVVAELGIADQLADRPKTAAEVAAASGANADALHRVLHMLASLGVFAEEESNRFGLTPLSECLRSGSAGSVRDTIRMYGETHWRAVGNLLHSVMTGSPAFEEIAGSPVWEYLASHLDEGERFARGMANVSSRENQAVARAYDFSPFHVVIDLGGGRGGLIAEILRANPGLRGILYDEPHVVSRPTELQESGVASRCQIVPGDFFESVPPGCDVYVLKRVLDGWDDDDALRILRRCRDAIPPHGRLLGIHALVPKMGPYSRKDVAILTTDLGMLVGGRGRERTEDEFRDLYLEAGFTVNRVIPTRSLLSITEGVPA